MPVSYILFVYIYHIRLSFLEIHLYYIRASSLFRCSLITSHVFLMIHRFCCVLFVLSLNIRDSVILPRKLKLFLCHPAQIRLSDPTYEPVNYCYL
jgi:hypothetical protein